MSGQNPKHKIMARVALFANWLSWPWLVVFGIAALLVLPQAYNQATQSSILGTLRVPENYLDLFGNFNTAIRIVINIATQILSGITGFLTLQAVSLGLYMLIETDLNYKLLKEEAQNE